MNKSYNFFHKELLIKSSNLINLNEQIKKNGVIRIERTKLDLFTFITKTIIAQQISNNVADSLWNKFCSLLKKNTPRIDDFTNKKNLSLVLEKVGLSKIKKSYIESFYSKIKKKKIFLDELDESEIRDELLMFRGIGNWTCDMVLIFLQKMNVYSKTDLVIKKTCIKLCEIEKGKLTLKKFSPYLTIFSLHLWKMSKRILNKLVLFLYFHL